MFDKSGADLKPLFRSKSGDKYFFSTEEKCYGQTNEMTIGHLSTKKDSLFARSLISRIASTVEPQKGVPHCGSPVVPAGIPREREGVGLKILSAGWDGIPARKMHSRKIPATPAL
jgi:hypothetical protein